MQRCHRRGHPLSAKPGNRETEGQDQQIRIIAGRNQKFFSFSNFRQACNHFNLSSALLTFGMSYPSASVRESAGGARESQTGGARSLVLTLLRRIPCLQGKIRGILFILGSKQPHHSCYRTHAARVLSETTLRRTGNSPEQNRKTSSLFKRKCLRLDKAFSLVEGSPVGYDSYEIKFCTSGQPALNKH